MKKMPKKYCDTAILKKTRAFVDYILNKINLDVVFSNKITLDAPFPKKFTIDALFPHNLTIDAFCP